MTYMPKRVQRERGKGWRTPICGCGCGQPARYVGRGSRWGNPAQVIEFSDGGAMVTVGVIPERIFCQSVTMAAKEAVYQYRLYITGKAGMQACEDAQADLKGHDLVCWCPQDQPCHADVLLEIANRETKQ